MSRESCTIDSSDGVKLDARIFRPTREDDEISDGSIAIVLVHPYSVMGGCQGLMKGIARGLAERGYPAVTFDQRGVGRSTGRATITGSSEVRDVVSVCRWVSQNLSCNRILLIPLLELVKNFRDMQNTKLQDIAGDALKPCIECIIQCYAYPWRLIQGTSVLPIFAEYLCLNFFPTVELHYLYDRIRGRVVDRLLCVIVLDQGAGAPIAGSAVDQVKEIVGYVSLGYPFGLTASILFGKHHKAILQSPKPKLFVMGTRDGFTSVKQLKNKLKSASGRAEIHLIEGVSHFQMEGPAYDAEMVKLIITFISSLTNPEQVANL